LDITDEFGNGQRRQELVSSDIVVRGRNSWVLWGDTLVVAARDGIYLMDGVGPTVCISRHIQPMWDAVAAAGKVVGRMAVFRNHLLVPMGTAPLGNRETWVCRLDKRISTGTGDVYPWVRWLVGACSFTNYFAVRTPTVSPRLVYGDNTRLRDGSTLFDETGATDADGTIPALSLTTKAFEPSSYREFVKDVRVDYVGGSGADVLDLGWARGEQTGGVLPSFTSATGAPAGNVTEGGAFVFPIAAEVRRIGFKLTQQGSAAQMRIRGLSFRSRMRGRQR
jgi:hypothetical protein